MYRSLLHQTSITYWEMRPYPVQMVPPFNQAQMYRALLHQTSRTYWKWQGSPLLIELKHTEAYYTKPVEPIEKWGGPPAKWAQVYRALLHQNSRTYREMRPYPVQMNPPLIKPNCTEPSYTKPVEPIEKWGGPPTNQTKVYRALLHQTSRIYWEMRRPFPTIKPQVYRALLH